MKLLEKLVSSFGVSGSEMDVRDLIMKEIRPFVDNVYVDKMGNLIARKNGKGPKVMVAAHMDEVGLMLKYIDDRGRIFFSTIGGISPVVLIGQKVRVPTKGGTVQGVITTNEISADKEIKNLPKNRELVVDTGLSKNELTRLGVEIGSYLPLVQETGYLGSGDIIYGKALDNRVGCFILIELAKRLKGVKYETYFVFTVQEEMGLYGAVTSAYKIEPDWAVIVDVRSANEFSDRPTKRLGQGPCISIKEMEMITNKCINDWIIDIAKKGKIPIQREVSDWGTTETVVVSMSRGGVPSSLIGIPIRNIHSTVEVGHMKDIENTILLLERLLKKPPLAYLDKFDRHVKP